MPLEIVRWSNAKDRRIFAGACRGQSSQRIKVAIMQGFGEGWSLRILQTHGIALPPCSDEIADCARSIADALSLAAREAELSVDDIEAIGLGMISHDVSRLAALMAERTGIPVVSRFPDRDCAVGGRGEPLSPLGDALLFRSTRHDRLLVQLGPSTRLTLIPSLTSQSLSCLDAGAGTDFLDRLVSQLSQGRYAYDPGGRLAVQGRASEALLQQWSSHPFLMKSDPRFVEADTFDESFLEASLTLARERHLSAKDVLCTANHWISRCLKDAVHWFVPFPHERIQAIVTGSGMKNGLLWKLTVEALEPLPVEKSDALGVPADIQDALHLALLAYLTAENLPGNIPEITGADAPRVLGTITPGAPRPWDRFVSNLMDRLDQEARRAA